jgi:hypothetical protein
MEGDKEEIKRTRIKANNNHRFSILCCPWSSMGHDIRTSVCFAKFGRDAAPLAPFD